MAVMGRDRVKVDVSFTIEGPTFPEWTEQEQIENTIGEEAVEELKEILQGAFMNGGVVSGTAVKNLTFVEVKDA